MELSKLILDNLIINQKAVAYNNNNNNNNNNKLIKQTLKELNKQEILSNFMNPKLD